MIYRRQHPQLANCHLLQRPESELRCPPLAERNIHSRNCTHASWWKTSILAADFDGHAVMSRLGLCGSASKIMLSFYSSFRPSPSSLGIERKLPTSSALTMLHQSRGDAWSNAICSGPTVDPDIHSWTGPAVDPDIHGWPGL